MMNKRSELGNSFREVTLGQPRGFAEILDAADQLDQDAQAELVEIINLRMAERARGRLAEVVTEARREFAAGQCRVIPAAELVSEAAG